MGGDARRMTRWSTTIVLVGAVASGTAGTAFGYASGGVNVPDSTFRQAAGTQLIDISVGPPAVGTTETLVIWPFYNSNDHWLLGVMADRSTGAKCGYDMGQWQCVPGRSGWQAGDIHVEVNTAVAMDCGLYTGVCTMDTLTVQSIPGPPSSLGGPPSGQPVSTNGSVVIMPASVYGHSASPTPSAPVYRPIATSAASSVAAPQTSQVQVAPATSSAATPPPTPSATPSTSVAALAPEIEASPTSINAENTSLATPQGADVGLYLALLIPILAGVAVPFGFLARRRRKERRAGQ